MNKDLDAKLKTFLSNETEESFDEKVKAQKKELLKQNFGIVERVDKQFITEDGRQLLREQY